jgi:hypothetical protein
MKKSWLVSVIIMLLLISAAAFAAGAADYYNYGNSTFNKGDYKKALSYYNYAVKLDPKNRDYYRAIASCYEKLGKPSMAEKYNNYADTLSKDKSENGVAAAGKIKATVFAGFTTVAMSKVNDFIDSMYSEAIAAGGTGQKQDLGGAFIIGAQGGYNVYPGLYVGPRFEFVDVPTAKTIYTGTFFFMPFSGESDYSESILPLLVGASYYYPIQGQKLVISGDLYIGYGFAGVGINQTLTELGSTATENPAYSGGAFVTDIGVNGSYKLTDAITAGLTLGYRLANVSQVTANQDYTVAGYGDIKKGDVLKDANNAVMPIDFSGLIISINGTYSF